MKAANTTLISGEISATGEVLADGPVEQANIPTLHVSNLVLFEDGVSNPPDQKHRAEAALQAETTLEIGAPVLGGYGYLSG